MNTFTKILAPVALSLAAFGANAAIVSTGGETYGEPAAVAQAAIAPAARTMASTFDTGGETYVGATNATVNFSSPTMSVGTGTPDFADLYQG